MMFLSEIYIYPVKSLQGISLESCLVEKRGLQDDRRYMIVDETGQFITQRTLPKMATIKTHLANGFLSLAAQDETLVINPFSFLDNERKRVTVWNDVLESILVGKEADDWLSQQLKQKVHLVYQPESSKRRMNTAFSLATDEVSFADGYPVLACTDASLKDVNARIENPVTMDRFRPNLVFSAVKTPFEEDYWQEIAVGEVVFSSVKPCVRCVMTTLDQKTGVFTGKEPLKTLATFRINAPYTAPLFGQNLIPRQTGYLKVGDALKVDI